ncbi:Spore germination protein A1 [Paenibacillus allorhizoplanae]|uniref:Spore germination protein A1 n=1 Tax=Paenibacillus allorhizoplanae TaxID=2905648 RepID=A0ABM9CRK6_9BACL|nr:spore germination protein [Paenibacillus allorhizoplanae]CAH1222476.1 Spore germination protein A1 [Paenibacillus allorhizoplanae]
MKWFRKWLYTKPGYPIIPEDHLSEEEKSGLTTDLEQNEFIFRRIFHKSDDIVFRKVEMCGQNHWLIIYFETLVDEVLIEDYVLKPMIAKSDKQEHVVIEKTDSLDDHIISTGLTCVTSKVSEIVKQVLKGQAAVLTIGNSDAMMVKVNNKSQRSLEEPSSEPVIRGPRDGFIENLSTNIGLIRSRIKTSRLKMECLTIGELTQTEVVITYIAGIASEAVIEEVRDRISRIQIDGIIDSGYVEEFIEDSPFSPFPLVHSTERPDVVAAELLEGKIGIIVDTSPFVLIVPMTFWTGLQASEDYYVRWPIATFVRWIRFLFISIAIFAPPLYVAITTFNQEMIPTNLVLSIASSREPVPFPAVIEAFIMEIIFEALREAGIRLPKQIGQAISIVGALVIGQAAVLAGIISAPVVIIVSITGIAAFTIPRYSFANGIRLLRFPMLLLAGTLGLYGIVIGFMGIVLHITSLRSFGVPYFTPAAPMTLSDLKDVFVRIPIWAKTQRPQSTASSNPVREPAGQKPSPENAGKGKRTSE